MKGSILHAHTILSKIVIFFIIMMPAQSLMAAPTSTPWKCGKWKEDPKGKCEEIQVCTRSVCKDIKTQNCQNETKTSCANPIPPKPDTSGNSLIIKKTSQTTGLKAEKPSSAKPLHLQGEKIGTNAGTVLVPAPTVLAPVPTAPSVTPPETVERYLVPNPNYKIETNKNKTRTSPRQLYVPRVIPVNKTGLNGSLHQKTVTTPSEVQTNRIGDVRVPKTQR